MANTETTSSNASRKPLTAKPIVTPFSTRISGTGSYLPEKVLTNFDLEKMVETNDAWIVERTGIARRHIAEDGLGPSDLAAVAAKRALEAAGLEATDLDCIIFATVSQDQITPSTSCGLQGKIGARAIASFDLGAACSGFVYALSVADQFIRTGVYKHILVIGAEVLHPFVDYKDRETCILFGDGAGAVIASRCDTTDKGPRVHSAHLRADGGLRDLFIMRAGGSIMPPASKEASEGANPYLKMRGREIFKHAVRTMSEVCQEALDANGMTIDQVDWLIPHQANLRIIDAVGKHFGIPPEKVIVNVQETGNTSAATVPIAFDEAVRDGRIKRGQTVLFTAFGSGLTSGSLLFRF